MSARGRGGKGNAPQAAGGAPPVGPVAALAIPAPSAVPIGGGTTFAQSPGGGLRLSARLTLSVSPANPLVRSLSDHTAGTPAGECEISHYLLASVLLRLTPIEEGARDLPFFGRVLSVQAVVRALDAVTNLCDPQELFVSPSAAIRAISARGLPETFFVAGDFVPVEPFPAGSEAALVHRWAQVQKLTFRDLMQPGDTSAATNSLVADLVAAVGPIGRAEDRGPAAQASMVVAGLLKDVDATVKATTPNLAPNLLACLRPLRAIPPAVAITVCGYSDMIDNLQFGRSQAEGKPGAVFTRLDLALAAFPSIAAAIAGASDGPGAVMSIAKALGHSEAIVFNTLQSIEGQLRAEFGDLLASTVPAGMLRVAFLAEQIEARARSAANFERANAASGLADPGAARKEIADNALLLSQPGFRSLETEMSSELRTERKLFLALTSNFKFLLRAFVDRSTAFKANQVCLMAAGGHAVLGPYLMFLLTHDRNMRPFSRLQNALVVLSADTMENLSRLRFNKVDWMDIATTTASYRSLTEKPSHSRPQLGRCPV